MVHKEVHLIKLFPQRQNIEDQSEELSIKEGKIK